MDLYTHDMYIDKYISMYIHNYIYIYTQTQKEHSFSVFLSRFNKKPVLNVTNFSGCGGGRAERP